MLVEIRASQLAGPQFFVLLGEEEDDPRGLPCVDLTRFQGSV
jgi:hypothetical protein